MSTPGTSQQLPGRPGSSNSNNATSGGTALPSERPALKKRRISSSAADMQSTINRPGAIKINVKGAYIIDHDLEDESSSSSSQSSSSNGNGSTHSNHTSPTGSPDRSSSSTSNGGTEEHSYQYHKRDIRLPNHTGVVSHVAADIGGSLAKVVYFSRENGSAEAGGRLNFLSFETDKIDECIEYLRQLQSKHRAASSGSRKDDSNSKPPSDELSIMATGGGAYKFYDRIKERLGVDVVREDEMECLIMGLDFFITEIPMEVFSYDEAVDVENPVEYQEPAGKSSSAEVYPYLLVNIGSGVSMIKVSGPAQYQRIGGTSLGGGTLWGLLSLLTGARNFDDMLSMADKGANSAVDLLVGDIYGEGMGYEKIGFSDRTIASSFGKVLKRKREAERRAEDGGGLSDGGDMENVLGKPQKESGDGTGCKLVGDGRMFKPEDISRSLLYAISNNIGQIAYLQSEKHDLRRIYFGGSFIRGHRQTIHTLSFAIKFWSKGTKQAYFLRHEGYLGAVGAFLKRRAVKWGMRGDADGAEG